MDLAEPAVATAVEANRNIPVVNEFTILLLFLGYGLSHLQSKTHAFVRVTTNGEEA